jgi:hypothetical protein
MTPILQHSSLNENGFKAYITYLALKRHFTSSYDYHKYNGKVNASYESFIKRRDAFSFQRISKQRDFENIILANMIENPKIWIGDLLGEGAREKYLGWKSKQGAITYHVSENLSELDDDFQSNFKVDKGCYPHLADLYLQKRISLETFCILVKLTNTQKYWEEAVIDKVIFPDIMRTVDKYYPFINFSSEKMKKVLKDHFF